MHLGQINKKLLEDYIGEFDVKEQSMWPYMNIEKINKRWTDIGICIKKNEAPVIVDVTSPKVAANEYPQRYSEKRFLDVSVTPMQHSAYVVTWYFMSALCFSYAFLFWKNPTAKGLLQSSKGKKRHTLSRSEMMQRGERNFKNV
ncbi:hypothetical protein RFI_12373 [Reticulomyxa filosa]|uniref:Uncharacterized protein n=1 Tax=Reticulomyxa filosa TaxID=46433 RepID=X6NHF1_RETFI|nr:hypothetical protein RFI_12373 [Reticulomyxa filosa]|eukprot:ETO24782.1 hypothetical protein RFI_12373 [Reticulomyxa filosa]